MSHLEIHSFFASRLFLSNSNPAEPCSSRVLSLLRPDKRGVSLIVDQGPFLINNRMYYTLS